MLVNNPPSNHWRRNKNSGKSELTARLLLLAIPLIVINAHWLNANWGAGGYETGQSFPTIVSLYFNAIFCFAALITINALLRQTCPKYSWSDEQLLCVYIILTVGSAVAGHDTLQILWPMVTHSIWFTTIENEWSLFHQHIPDFLTIKDRSALVEFYQGASTFHTKAHLSLWLIPVLCWSAFFCTLILMMLCLVVLVRKKWIKHEKLSYPIIQIPMAMVMEVDSFFKNKLMWMGFGLASTTNLINGLHFLYPQIPGLGGSFYDIGSVIDTKPFSAIGYTPLAAFPFAVGLSFLIPLELSFSIWFFYLFGKITRIMGSVSGLSNVPGFPFTEGQSTGAWIGLALVVLWMNKKHLLAELKTALRTGKREGDDPISAQSATIGFLLGCFFVIAFCTVAGAQLWAVCSYFFLFFTIALAITRIRAEVGPPSHQVFTQPTQALVTFFGSRKIEAPSLTLFTLFRSFNRSYRNHPMPNLLEGFAIAARRGISSKRLLGAMVLAVVIGTLTSAWSYYAYGYRYGAAHYGEQNQCRWYFDQLTLWITSPTLANGPGIVATLIGAGFTCGLMMLRNLFLWWPFHPAGYSISLGEWNMNWYWFSIFVSWLLKLLILRLGQVQAHRRAIPFFMGLVLGEFMVGGSWGLLGIMLEQPMYRFMP